MFENKLKIQPTKPSIFLVLLAIVLICDLVAFDSAAAFNKPILPIFALNPSEVHEVAKGNKTKIDRLIISLETKNMAKESPKSKNQNSLKSQMITQAKEDLSERLSIKADQIRLLEVREVTWPDSSLGCPQPAKVYNQVLQDGFLIRLEVGGRMYFYHSGRDLDPFLCDQTSRIIPHPNGGDEFVPPPGSEID